MVITHYLLFDHVLDTYLWSSNPVLGSPPGAGDLGEKKDPYLQGDYGPVGDTGNREVNIQIRASRL